MIRKILIGLLLALPAIALAEEPEISAQSHLNEVIEKILSADGTISSRVITIKAEQEEAQAENMAPSPEIEFEHLWGRGQNRWSASVTQEIEWPGLYRSRSRQAQIQRSKSEAMYGIYVADRALTLKLIFIDLVNANLRCQLYREIADNIDSIASATQISYDMGEATVLDLRKAQIAAANARADVRMAEADLINLTGSTGGFGIYTQELTKLPLDAYPIQPLDDPVQSSDTIFQPYIDACAESYANSIRVAKMSSLPSFSLGYVHAYEDRNHFNGFKVSLTLPSFDRKKRLRAAELSGMAAIFDQEAEYLNVIAECTAQYATALKLKEELDRYAGLIDDNSYMELLKMAFDSGEMTVVDYITEINLFRQSRLTYLDLEYRYNLALTRTNRYRGIGF